VPVQNDQAPQRLPLDEIAAVKQAAQFIRVDLGVVVLVCQGQQSSRRTIGPSAAAFK